MIRNFRPQVILLVVVSLLLAGCSSTPVPVPEVKRPCPVEILAIAPMMAADVSGDGVSAICPITTGIHTGQEVMPLAVASISAMLPQAVEDRFDCRIIDVDRMAKSLGPRPARRGRPVRQALSRAARANGAQAVLTGTIFKYQEHEGSTIGVEKPAGVYLGLYLIDVRDSRVVWQDFFSETQKSLSEDIFNAAKFFERGGQWVTADELAKYGLDRAVKSMPSLIRE